MIGDRFRIEYRDAQAPQGDRVGALFFGDALMMESYVFVVKGDVARADEHNRDMLCFWLKTRAEQFEKGTGVYK